MELLNSVRRWRRRRTEMATFQRLGHDGQEQLSRDLGLEHGTLIRLVGSEPREELTKLLGAVELCPEVVRARWPGVCQDMALVCTACAERSTCRRQLEAGQAGQNYATYCPNAPTIQALLLDGEIARAP